jgi:phosphate transport system substrate-binding protein
MFTWRQPAAEETTRRNVESAKRSVSDALCQTTIRGDVVIKNTLGALAGCALLTLGLAACGSSSSSSSSGTTASSGGSATISGAGSTFAAPVYQQWASSLSGVTVNYQSVGSGAGITALETKTVDFGASDPPLKPADESAIAKNGSPAVQIPMFLGAITVSYNLPGVATGMKLDGKTIADIYLGRIKTWNDAEIKALNPSVSLPSTAITVIHRSDSSGTTAGFTSFLAAVDPEFKSKVGEGKDVQWPTGTGAKGNAGVAGAVQQTVGAVGYVEQAYALQHNFTYAAVKNKAGSFVLPTLASTSAAAEGVKVPANLGIKIVNPAGAGSYPITSQTFIVDNKDLCKAGLPGGEAAAKGVVKLLAYGLGSGQSILSQADYAALPAPILAKSKEAVAGLQCNGASLGG